MENKKMRIIIIISCICLIIAVITIFLIKRNSENNEWINPYSEIDKNEIEYKENVSVEQLKEKTGLEADSNLYEIKTEYDGRKVLSIKKDIQYKVAFAGIIKGQIPSINEIDSIYNEKHLTGNGIWINAKSRSSFLDLLKGNTNSEYGINEDGYLKIKNINQPNENDKLLGNLINSDKKIIIDINEMYYEIDVVTGEIVEYPFEKLDNYQTFEKIENLNEKIIFITTNKNKKLTNKEIIEDLLINL